MAAHQHTETVEHPRRYQIIAVDDNRDILVAVQRLLRNRGFDVHPYNDPHEALGVLEEDPRRFDLMMLDVHLGQDISGLDILTWVKEVAPHLPVIMLTANEDAYTARAALKAGAFDYLLKPLENREDVESIVVKAVRYGQLQKRARQLESEMDLQQSSVSSPTIVPPRDSTNLDEFGWAMAMTFDEARRQVLGRFERGYAHHLLAVTGGDVVQAGEISGLDGTALHQLFAELGIDPERYRQRRSDGDNGQEVDCSRHRLLALDRDESFAAVLERVLSGRGFDVEPLTDPARALRVVETDAYRFDLMTLDALVGPGDQGLDILHRVRELAPGLPVIVVTADGSAMTARSMLRAGAFDYIVKPLDDVEVVGEIFAKAAQLGQLHRRAREPE
ncbi:MAG: response regulator [Proteobacteria bacterium]|nr:response regulator [Pseudomonadota bacterium]